MPNNTQPKTPWYDDETITALLDAELAIEQWQPILAHIRALPPRYTAERIESEVRHGN